ncbi:hypothetical protein BFW01_g1807 [Lasiodiplodia theobromae]|uniref:Transmembrane protein n=1 Tax=Lasiodiplodia theobromae TaxID=45133 RepID=A0A8H7MEC7_9PEZI|nr:hypothetical protein BFW01_g1807 [Lasiodiplodia theobromae]
MNADDSRGKKLLQTPRRFVPELRGIPVGSLLENITMPQLRISEFDWLDTLESVPQDVRSAVQEVKSGWFNYSRHESPLYSFPGAVTLTHRNNFSSMPMHALPQPRTVQAQTFAALFVFKHDPDKDGLPNCSIDVNGRPSDPPVREYFQMKPFQDNRTYCIAVAKVTFNAGVVSCKHSAQLVAESLAECQNDQQSDLLAPDPLVEFALALTPETVMQVNMMNTTGWDFENGAAHYVQNILNVAYQGAWSATAYFTNNGPDTLTTVAYERIQAVRAEVTAWRVWLWLVLNGVLTLTGLVVYYLQSRVVRPVVQDPVLTAVMMDPSNILKHDRDGICDIDNIGGSDKHDRLLSLSCMPRVGGQWRHDMLNLQRRSTDRS